MASRACYIGVIGLSEGGPATRDLPGTDENRDSPERDMVNPSTDSYMWPIRDTH